MGATEVKGGLGRERAAGGAGRMARAARMARRLKPPLGLRVAEATWDVTAPVIARSERSE